MWYKMSVVEEVRKYSNESSKNEAIKIPLIERKWKIHLSTFFLCICVHDVCACVYACSDLCDERCASNTDPQVCLYMCMTRFDMWSLFYHSPPYPLRTSLSLNPGLASLSSIASYPTPTGPFLFP